MRLLRRTSICAAACGALIAAGAAGAGASTPVAKLRGFSCQRAVNPVGRGVAVSAVMRPVKGTRRMALRFELLSRARSGGAWTSISGGDLRSWLTPRNATLGQRPGDVWIVNKSVNELAAPAQYRFRVSFRWTGTHGRTLSTTSRTTATCTQPELRPDLLVSSIGVGPLAGHPRANLYTATVANHGVTAARNFNVQFAIPGGNSQKHLVRLLRGHAETRVTFKGPACSTTAAITLTVDPDGVVDDFDRTNNTRTVVCPNASGTG